MSIDRNIDGNIDGIKIGIAEKAMLFFLTLAISLQRIIRVAGTIGMVVSILIFLYLLWKYYREGSLKLRALPFIGYYKCIAILILASIPSFFGSIDLNTSLRMFGNLWLYRTMPLFMITLCIREKKYIIYAILLLMISLDLDMLLAGYQVFFGNENRGGGFSENLMYLASIVSVVLPMSLILTLNKDFPIKWRVSGVILLVCSMIAAVVGQSRGLWLSLIPIVIFVYFYYAKNSKKIFAIGIVMAILSGMFLINSQVYRDRFLSIGKVKSDNSQKARLYLYKEGINIWLEKPLTGVGLENATKELRFKYGTKNNWNNYSHLHNNFIQILADGGIVLLFSFIYFIYYVIKDNFIAWKRNKNIYSFMILMGFIGLVLFGCTDLPLYQSSVMRLWWFILGSLLVFRNLIKKR